MAAVVAVAVAVAAAAVAVAVAAAAVAVAASAVAVTVGDAVTSAVMVIFIARATFCFVDNDIRCTDMVFAIGKQKSLSSLSTKQKSRLAVKESSDSSWVNKFSDKSEEIVVLYYSFL